MMKIRAVTMFAIAQAVLAKQHANERRENGRQAFLMAVSTSHLTATKRSRVTSTGLKKTQKAEEKEQIDDGTKW